MPKLKMTKTKGQTINVSEGATAPIDEPSPGEKLDEMVNKINDEIETTGSMERDQAIQIM